MSSIDNILRGAAECHTKAELTKLMQFDSSPVIKLGVDPTSPNLHLGHAVVLRKLRDFQDDGCRAVLIIGDFTASIGDPTGRSATRPVLSPEEIKSNAQTYIDQANKILDLNKLQVVYNSEWFNDFSMADMISLAGKFTVAQILERNDFAKRLTEHNPIGMHELLYPMLQALDSVQIKADVEIGGTDQLFNITAGRDLMRSLGMKPQVCLTMPILTGCGVKEKMSKSLNNSIGITESPNEMYGKVMSISDDQLGDWFRLLTRLSNDAIVEQIANPLKAKKLLASMIVDDFHGLQASVDASAYFDNVIRGRQIPKEMPTMIFDLPDRELRLVEMLVLVGFASSKSDARRLIEGKGVRVNGENVLDIKAQLADNRAHVINKGSHHWVRIVLGQE